MKNTWLSTRCLLFVLAALLPGLARAEEAKTCWKDSEARGFALLPNCGNGEEKSLGLCYPVCRAGYAGIGALCTQGCPAGWEDIGVSCTKPEAATRPTFAKEILSTAVYYSKGQCDVKWPRGYLSQDGVLRRGYDPIPSSGSNAMRSDEIAVNLKPVVDPRNGGECWVCPEGFERSMAAITESNACVRRAERNNLCEKWSRDHGGPGSCEEINGLLYPRPPKDWTCTLNNCAPKCPSGFRDDGTHCAKLTAAYGRSIGTVGQTCPSGTSYEAGLCYPACRAGYEPVGVRCWARCAAGTKYPTDCAAACAKDDLSCGVEITEQVLAVMDVVVTVASTAASMGSTAAIKSALQKAVLDGVKKTTRKLIEKQVSKAAIKKTIVEIGKESGSFLVENQADIVASIAFGEEFDWSALDPSGIASLVKAYNKPKCSEVQGTAPASNESPGGTPTTTYSGGDRPSTALSSTPPDPANAKWERMVDSAQPGLTMSEVAAGGNGEIWAIGTDQQAGGSAIYNWGRGQWRLVPGAGKHLAVDPRGAPWVVNDKGGIQRWDESRRKWQPWPGLATDIAIGGDNGDQGHVWVLGNEPVAGGYKIHRWDWASSAWVPVPGGAVQIAVHPATGNLFAINDRNEIFAYDVKTQQWTKANGMGKDIGAGGPNVFVLGTNAATNGQGLHYADFGAQGWKPYPGGLTQLAVQANGKPVGVNAKGEVHRVQ